MRGAAAEHLPDATDGLAHVGLVEELGEGMQGDSELTRESMQGLLGVEVAVEDGVEIEADWCLSGIHGGRIRWLNGGVNRVLVGFLKKGTRHWALGTGKEEMGARIGKWKG